MPWTESRSRDEWLAEVQRRGGRIRRRRRVRFGVVGALAMVLPVSVMATVLGGGTERAVELSVAGPKPAGDGPTTPTTAAVDDPVQSSAATIDEPRPPTGAPSATTTTEVHRREASVNGPAVEPTPPRTVPPTDNPVVAGPDPSGRSAGSANSGAPSSAIQAPATTMPPGPVKRARPCAASEVKATVTMDQPVYTRGQAVSGSSTLENISGADCHLEMVDAEGRLSYSAYYRFEDAAGRADWFQASTGSDCGCKQQDGEWVPVPVEPQKTFSYRFSYEPGACALSCPLLPPTGRYSIVVEWMSSMESGPTAKDSGRYIARGSFEYSTNA